MITRETRMKSILDPSFEYTPSAETDLRKTFAKLRRRQNLLRQNLLGSMRPQATGMNSAPVIFITTRQPKNPVATSDA